jgi:DNA-binding PadR family transcriptional regulator
MYGYKIPQKVKDLTSVEIKITAGTVYSALHKLETNGILLTEI